MLCSLLVVVTGTFKFAIAFLLRQTFDFAELFLVTKVSLSVKCDDWPLE